MVQSGVSPIVSLMLHIIDKKVLNDNVFYSMNTIVESF